MEEVILKTVGWIIMTTVVIVWIMVLRKLARLEPMNNLDRLALNSKVADAAVIILLTLIIFLMVARWTFAAENPAPPAPAENQAVAEKPVALCPTEFNIDDPAWAMHRIENPRVKELAEHVVAMEHVRVFSYFPGVEKRIFIGIKNLENPDCVAKLYSYGLPSDVDGKRVFAIIKSHGKMTAFLLTDKGWESGDKLKIFTPDCNANQCNLVFALYRNEVVVASRMLTIKQVLDSDWIYERFGSKPVE